MKRNAPSGRNEGPCVPKMIRVRTDDIRLRGDVERGTEDVSALAASIARHGLLQPVVVRYDRGRYRLVCGARRLAACRLIGMQEMDVLLLDADEAEAVACFLEEHLVRREPCALDEAAMILSAGMENVTAKSVIDAQSVERRCSLLNLHERTRHIVRLRALSAQQALPLLHLKDPQRQMEAALIAAERGLTPRQVQRLAQDPGMNQSRSCTGRRRAVKLAIEHAKRIAQNLCDMGVRASVDVQAQSGGICVQILLPREENAPSQQELSKKPRNI